jgi:hypothetical protein
MLLRDGRPIKPQIADPEDDQIRKPREVLPNERTVMTPAPKNSQTTYHLDSGEGVRTRRRK